MKKSLLFWILGIGLVFPGKAWAAPAINNVTDNRTAYSNSQIPLYKKFEVTFQITGTTATNFQFPYYDASARPINCNDPIACPIPNGITVNGEFLPPGALAWIKQPAFYYYGYTDGGNKVSWADDGQQVLYFPWYYPSGQNSWKVRFAPNKIGEWQYRLSATDASGTVQTASLGSFTVTANPGSRGFIKVSPQDSRYFVFDDGTTFYPQGITSGDLSDTNLQSLSQKGITLVRNWIESMYGSAWLEWIGTRDAYDGYMPRAGLEGFRDSTTGKNQLTVVLTSAASMNAGGWYDACRFNRALQTEPIKQNTNYRMELKYQATCLNPIDAAKPYGIVGKISDPANLWPNECYNSSVQRAVTNYGHNASSWTTLTGSWNSGNLNFIPRVAFGLENVADGTNCAAKAWVDSISLREDLGNGQYGPEILAEPSMQYDTYIKDRQAFQLDKGVEAAEKYGVFLKLVLLDKNDAVFNKINNDSTYVISGNDNEGGFYGNWRYFNKTRYLQQAYWRYLQARWGYSTAIHSWETTNEGAVGNGNLYAQTDELGKTMHCYAFGVNVGTGDGQKCVFDHPNDHLVTTSFWYGYDAAGFWGNANYPNVDYGDVHDYINKPDEPAHYYDTALATYDLGKADGALTSGTNKPVMRGETGLITDGGTDAVSTEMDINGVWLHNFIWGNINPYGLSEIWWHTSQFTSKGKDVSVFYKSYLDFMNNIPLAQGKYIDAQAVASDTNVRVWGQKDSVGQTASHAHLWVQNKKHLWCSVAGITNSYCPTWDNSRLNGTVTLTGFTPNTALAVEFWNFDNTVTLTKSTATVTSNAAGQITLNLAALPATTTDLGVKLGEYSNLIPSPTPTTGLKPGDYNGDGRVDYRDLIFFIPRFGQNGLNIFSLNSLVKNFGN